MSEINQYSHPLIEQKMEIAGKEIENLMVYYPCLREICKGLEKAAYPAALFTGACFLGTLMTRCTYRFYFRPSLLLLACTSCWQSLLPVRRKKG